MTNYACRMSVEWNDVAETMSSLFQEMCAKAIVFEHPKDEEVSRTHIHFLMIGYTPKSILTFKRKFSFLELTGNSSWSFKTSYGEDKLVDNGFITYMAKGEFAPVYNYNFTQEEIEEATVLSYKPKEKRQGRLKIVGQTIPRQTQYEMYVELKNRYHEEQPRDDNQLVLLIVKFLKQKRIMYSEFNVINYFGMLQSEFSEHRFVQRILNKISR